ncbi:hypothetical protein GV827_16840 [Sulfitobacter sp. JBTF-M27]|uniref:Uncharacterized protein n=1 Tax=Sulfitobacter sediminilitoris TaxID=2698830 RepID=A0A6P0CCX9_9RHOB|nr:hypothetical protein [Sulfitobacter sediminilitoris]NEK24059.1 hypothetical protein [Sulfitobacter sediminilitoris]
MKRLRADQRGRLYLADPKDQVEGRLAIAGVSDCGTLPILERLRPL